MILEIYDDLTDPFPVQKGIHIWTIKGTVSAVFSNPLKSRKSPHLHWHWKSKNNTVEPLVGDHPLYKKKWSLTGGGLSWEVLHGYKRAS